VDDNASSRDVLTEILTLWGAEIRGVSNADKAVKELHGSGTKPFDILFVDQLMPGKDGVALAHSIREEFGVEMPIVILSQSYFDCSAFFKNLDNICCCQKPFKRRDLARAVFTALGKPMESRQDDAEIDNMLPPMRILVAEDNPSNREIVRLYLSDSPVHVDMVENGAEALKKIGQSRYDAVLMDMEMPVMDGYEATATLRKMEADNPDQPETPVIALTAHSFAEHRDRCREAGCDDYLVKPVKKETLHDALLRFAPKDAEQPSGVRETVPEIFRGLIPRFLEHSVRDSREMLAAMENNDFERIRSLGHKVGGAAYGFGMSHLGRMCREVESLAEARDAAALDEILAGLASYFDVVDVKFN